MKINWKHFQASKHEINKKEKKLKNVASNAYFFFFKYLIWPFPFSLNKVSLGNRHLIKVYLFICIFNNNIF